MGMSDAYVIGVDSSTTATKALVWDMSGTRVAEGRAEIPLSRPGRGLYEQDPEEWWTALCAATRGALAGAPRGIVAVAVANQRETVAALDAALRPVRPAMLWCDERGRAQVARVAADLGAERVHDRTGKPVELCPALYRILWLRDAEPASFSRARHFVDVAGYLNWRLTGNLVTSWASADPFGLLEMRRFTWDTALMGELGLAPAAFTPLAAPGTPIGRVTPEAARASGLPAGTLVVTGGGDGQAAGLGAAALGAGRAYCNLGTAAVAGVGTAEYRADLAFRTMTSCNAGAYVCEALLRTGTSLVTWFVEQFGPPGSPGPAQQAEDILEAAATRIPPGSEGLLVLPHWNAAGTPHWDGDARGAVVGWTPTHTRGHFYRAVLEGLAMELRLALDGIARVTGEPIDYLVLTGGGARSALWRQIVADATGRAVVLVASTELTSLGAGMLAAAGSGAFSDARAAAAAMTRDVRTIMPGAAARELYDLLFRRAYRPLYPALRAISHSISALEQEGRWRNPGVPA
ncbi:MAG: FGGY-family carbohydrate kinase [Chloroflexota bacterium]